MHGHCVYKHNTVYTVANHKSQSSVRRLLGHKHTHVQLKHCMDKLSKSTYPSLAPLPFL